jgi:capsular exopolysaccharide synthesis family protein
VRSCRTSPLCESNIGNEDLVELRDAIAALRAGWFLPVIGLLLGGAAGAVTALLMTPTYTSATQLFVTTTDATSTAAAFQGSQFSQNRVTSYVQLLTSERLADGVTSALDLDLTARELQEKIEASVVPDTTVLDIVVTDTSPERARDLAAAIATEFTSLVEEVEATTTTPTIPGAAPVTTVPVKVTVLDSPEVPTEPASPDLYRNIAVGVLIGLVVGFVSAYFRVRMDRSIRDPKVASSVAGAPVIGVVTRDPQLASKHVLERHSRSAAAESFRQMRTNLQFLDVDHPPRVIMVSSSVAGEGKSTVAVNLAVSLAEGGHRVTIVEADLRRPRVTRYLGLVDGAGLTSILSGAADLDDVLQTYGNGGLSVLAAGSIPPNPSELLSSSRLGGLVEDLRARNDFVIFDTPPLLPVSDGSAVAVVMDGVLLSVRHGKTRREELEQAAAVLTRVGAKMLGVVLTVVPPSAEASKVYGYDSDVPVAASEEARPALAAQAAASTGVKPVEGAGATSKKRRPARRTDGARSEDAVGSEAKPTGATGR